MWTSLCPEGCERCQGSRCHEFSIHLFQLELLDSDREVILFKAQSPIASYRCYRNINE